MQNLEVLVIGVTVAGRCELTQRLERLGHRARSISATVLSEVDSAAYDVVLIDARREAVDPAIVADRLSIDHPPVLVVGERPIDISDVAPAMFCFSDESNDGYQMALHMCAALGESALVEERLEARARPLAPGRCAGAWGLVPVRLSPWRTAGARRPARRARQRA